MASRMAALAVLAVLAGGIGGALAETVALHGDLTGTNSVPPNDSPGAGRAEATLDTQTRRLTWTVTYSGLTGPAAGAHFHGPAEAGRNAGIVLPFASPASPISGEAVISESQAADLLAGRWYANVHTAKHPGGEIRGQMVK